jgi:hypothetical protein
MAWFIFNGANIGTSTLSHGLFDGAGPRPIAAAYATMTDTLGAGVVEDTLPVENSTFLLWRRSNGKLIGVAFANEEKRILVETDVPELQCRDIFGNIRILKARNGMVELKMDKIPCYLEGAGKIALSRRVEIALTDVSTSEKQCGLLLQCRNNSAESVTIDVKLTSHPLMQLSCNAMKLTIPANTLKKVDIPARFLRRDYRRVFTVKAEASAPDGTVYHSTCSSFFAGCHRLPAGTSPRQALQHFQPFPADRKNQTLQLGKAPWKGVRDLSAMVWTMYDATNLYVAVRTRDDIYHAVQEPEFMFFNDSLEIGLRFGETEYQILAGQSTAGNALYCHRPFEGKFPGKVEITPYGEAGGREYLVTLPWSAFKDVKPAPGDEFLFGIIIDDSDGENNDRKFIHYYGDGIHYRDLGRFAKVRFYK